MLAAAILLLLAASLLASFWINRDAGKREIDAAFARATGGSATYERIDLNFLPSPGAVVTRPRISKAGVVEMQAESMSVRFDVLALLAGRVRLRSVQVSSPRALLEFPAPREGGKPFDAAGMEQQVRAALGQVARLAPDAALVVDDGRVDVLIGGRAALELRKVDFRFDSASGKLAVDLSCSGNLWTQLKLAASLSATDLSGEGRAEVSGLRAGDLGAALGLPGQWPVAEALADASMQWKMAGLRNLNASASVASRAAVLQAGKQRVPIEGLSAELAFESDDDFTRWTVRRLKLDVPRLSVGWTLTQRADAAELQLDASDSDIVTLRELDRLDLLAQGSGRARLETGTIKALRLRTRAPSVDRLFELPNLEIQGDFEDARLFLPDYALALEGVRASVMTSGGSWAMEKVEARLGRTSMREGRLAGKFSVVPQPLHVDAQLRVDLAEAHELAKRLVREPQARAQLERIREVQGTAQLRMVLGETLERLEPDLEIASIQLAARHSAVALPIRISSGKLGYRKRELRFDAVDGALGSSTFAGATGRLQLAGPGRIDLRRADAELALDELFASLKGREDLAALKPLRALGGAASVSLTQLDASLGEPGTLQFRASVLPRRLSIDMPGFFPPVMLDGGEVLVTQKDLEFQSVKATSLDAALTLTGRAEDYRNGASALRGKADGAVGAQALQWAEQRAGIAREFHLVPPLAIESVEANWVRGGDMSASGRLDFAGGPVVRFAAARAGERLDVRNLSVRDAASDATFSGSFSGTRAQAGFKGKLLASTVHRIFSHQRFEGVEIEGDLQARGDLEDALNASVTGSLRGSGVPMPGDLAHPVMLERFSVTAEGDTLRIESAKLESDGNRVDLSGQVKREPGGYAVDIDVRGDEITIRDSASEGDEERARREIPESGKLLDRLAATQVSGRIAVDFRKVRFGKFEIAPLVAVGRHYAPARGPADHAGGAVRHFHGGHGDLASQGRVVAGDARCARPADRRFRLTA